MESLKVVVVLVVICSAVARSYYPFPLDNIQCPDRQSECPNNSTCCKVSSSSSHDYQCCPLANAVCCNDVGSHCCPGGTTCSNVGTCTNQNGDVFPATHTTVEVTSKWCPDKKAICPSATDTCCRVKDGSYGCCHLANAVCCSDGIHCCQYGYTCTADSKGCQQNDNPTDMLKASELDMGAGTVVQTMLKRSHMICPDNGQCSNGDTCCPSSDGKYGCCPLSDAVCCGDGKHCCPMGYTCDLNKGTCDRDGLDISTLLDLVAKVIEKRPVGAIVCPDQHSLCPSESTCCRTQSGGYGCCPLVSGVCCGDGVHCCPKDYSCHTDGTCSRADSFIKVLEKQPTSVGNVVCPDGKSSCPTGNTCCLTSAKKYGCCPLPNAVCCSDGRCCPNDYACNDDGTCTDAGSVIKAFKKQPAIVRNVVCPDGQSECPSDNTCCRLQSGQYGCCPEPNAVCCSDKKHCCPEGYKCNDGTCTKGDSVIKMLEKQPASSLVRNVICPNGESDCPDGNTCCMLSDGQYGCCPLRNAVCCSDGRHCCPNGYDCDTGNGTCTRADSVMHMVDLMEKQPLSVPNMECPDGGSCPSGNTCCKTKTGKYGCCPLPNAVCCSDDKHCCPNGYVCDTGNGTCSRADSVMVDLMEKQPLSVRNVVCPDHESCPSENTCCKTTTEKYGCCPEPNAVCCSDKKHCCPHGYKCNDGNSTCTMGDSVIKMLEKQPASSLVRNVICPKGQSECPDGNTCCMLSDGQYGCCPEPNAVCCSDDKHCCPHGYVCNTGRGTCSRADSVMVDLMEKQPLSVPNMECPDDGSCPSGDTCCELTTGGYGCCPLGNAVCCSDGKHCCPNGYVCNAGRGTCSRADSVMVDLMEKQPLSVPNMECPDGRSCPSGNTCCKTKTGKYGCCPVSHAVCCSDETHCCPEGYKCDDSRGTCSKGGSVIKMLEKQPASSLVRNVICPNGQSECPDKNTCCMLTSGQYGCCPLSNGVCCSDGKHCCPKGDICDVKDGGCSKSGSSLVKLLVKKAAKKLSIMPVATGDHAVNRL